MSVYCTSLAALRPVVVWMYALTCSFFTSRCYFLWLWSNYYCSFCSQSSPLQHIPIRPWSSGDVLRRRGWSTWSDGCLSTVVDACVLFYGYVETDACSKLASGVGSILILAAMVIERKFCQLRPVKIQITQLWITSFLCDARAKTLLSPCRYSRISSDHPSMLTVWGSLSVSLHCCTLLYLVGKCPLAS